MPMEPMTAAVRVSRAADYGPVESAVGAGGDEARSQADGAQGAGGAALKSERVERM